MTKTPIHRRNPLLPWYVGIAIVLAAVPYVGFQAYCTNCGAGPVPLFMVLVVVPTVYLVLMYLTFTSQAKDEKRDKRDYDPR